MAKPQQITHQVRGYRSSRARKIAIAALRKRGYNHFVCFRDVQAEFALKYGRAAWVQGGAYVCR